MVHTRSNGSYRLVLKRFIISFIHLFHCKCLGTQYDCPAHKNGFKHWFYISIMHFWHVYSLTLVPQAPRVKCFNAERKLLSHLAFKLKEKWYEKSPGSGTIANRSPSQTPRGRGNRQNQTSANRTNVRKALRLALFSPSEAVAMLKGLKTQEQNNTR